MGKYSFFKCKNLQCIAIFIQNVCTVSSDIFFNSIFIYFKHIQKVNDINQKGIFIYFLIPTVINYFLKTILALDSRYLGGHIISLAGFSFISSILIFIFYQMDNLLYTNYKILIIFVCLLNIINSIALQMHKNIFTTPIIDNYDNINKRIIKILIEEIPVYLLATFLAVYDSGNQLYFNLYLLLSGSLFFINSIILCLIAKFIDYTRLVEVKPKIIKDNFQLILYLLKVIGEANETILYYTLATKLKEHNHLFYFFSVQFLLKLGYKKLPIEKLYIFAIFKLIFYVGSGFFLCNLSLLKYKLFSLIAIILNGITNQMAFATYDFHLNVEATNYMAEFSIFVIIMAYIIVFGFQNREKELFDIIFMSNVRL